MVSSSSTKKAARLAQKGKGKRVRFQGGTLFPMIVLAILVIGVGTIVYARASVPAADSSPPTAEDHWHMAYGFSLCDQPGVTVQLNGNLEDPADPNYDEYVTTYVHSHDDGVIHWHPFNGRAVGKRATLGVFLDTYGVELTDESLKFPEGQNVNGLSEYIEGETTCPDGEDGELSVTVWQSPDDTSDGDRYVSGFDDIRMTKNSMVFTIAFEPRGTEVTKPEPQSSQLEELGAVDSGQTPIPGDTSVSVPATSTPDAGSTPADSSAPAVGEPSSASTPTPTSAAPATTAAG
jgi:hypothetical protein